MFAARIEFNLGGQIVPVMEDLQHLHTLHGSLGFYSVTFVETTIVILAFALTALLYTMGARKLALEEVSHHD